MKRKKLFILFAFVLMIVLLSNIFAVTIQSYKPKYGKTTAKLNFRSMATVGPTGIIKVLNKGDYVKMVGEIDNFYVVQLSTNQVGLVYKSYITQISTPPPNAKIYTSITPYNATLLYNSNIRRGPSTSFTRVTTLSKGTNVKVIGKIDDFYTVIYSNNKVGMIYETLLKKTVETSPTTTTTPTTLSNVDLIYKYINDERTAARTSKTYKRSKNNGYCSA